MKTIRFLRAALFALLALLTPARHAASIF